MSLPHNFSHIVSSQVIVIDMLFYVSVIYFCIYRINFFMYFLPKMLHSHVLAYRDR